VCDDDTLIIGFRVMRCTLFKHLAEGLLHLECGEKAYAYDYPLPYFNRYLYYTIEIFICQEGRDAGTPPRAPLKYLNQIACQLWLSFQTF